MGQDETGLGVCPVDRAAVQLASGCCGASSGREEEQGVGGVGWGPQTSTAGIWLGLLKVPGAFFHLFSPVLTLSCDPGVTDTWQYWAALWAEGSLQDGAGQGRDGAWVRDGGLGQLCPPSLSQSQCLCFPSCKREHCTSGAGSVTQARLGWVPGPARPTCLSVSPGSSRLGG